MKEIDINHFMNQLGMSATDFERWKTKEALLLEEEHPITNDQIQSIPNPTLTFN